MRPSVVHLSKSFPHCITNNSLFPRRDELSDEGEKKSSISSILNKSLGIKAGLNGSGTDLSASHTSLTERKSGKDRNAAAGTRGSIKSAEARKKGKDMRQTFAATPSYAKLV